MIEEAEKAHDYLPFIEVSAVMSERLKEGTGFWEGSG